MFYRINILTLFQDEDGMFGQGLGRGLKVSLSKDYSLRYKQEADDGDMGFQSNKRFFVNPISMVRHFGA